jgi:4-oxalmesaconate hydratase
MIIDCHGHYTTVPQGLKDYREQQLEAYKKDPKAVQTKGTVKVTDDEIRETLEKAQLKTARERGTDMTIFSPIAGAMAHHLGNADTSKYWSEQCNEMIHRVVTMYPKNFAGVCQLPQSPGVPASNCIGELERCVKEFGFIGCNLNPDPSGGYWTDPPLTDRKWWYPLYEKLVELDVPAMIHTASSCNPNFHGTGAHYLCGDTTAFMQFITGDIFKDFPTLKLIIPHGGGAVPYHWGRYRGLAQDMKRPPLTELLKNVYFDTCVYHQAGIDLLLKIIPADNILFASEIYGAVKGVDPETGFNYDDTKRYIENNKSISAADKEKIFHGNVLKVYPRFAKRKAA